MSGLLKTPGNPRIFFTPLQHEILAALRQRSCSRRGKKKRRGPQDDTTAWHHEGKDRYNAALTATESILNNGYTIVDGVNTPIHHRRPQCIKAVQQFVFAHCQKDNNRFFEDKGCGRKVGLRTLEHILEWVFKTRVDRADINLAIDQAIESNPENRTDLDNLIEEAINQSHSRRLKDVDNISL